MRRNDQVIVVNPEITHGRMRQIELETLPMIAVIERHPYARFRPREQKSLANGVFAHGVDRRVVRQTAGDKLPRFSAVVRAIDVWMLIIYAKTTHRSVRCLVIEVRRDELRHLAPRRQFRRRDVFPVGSGVARGPNQPVVGSRPQRVQRFKRRCQRIDNSALFIGVGVFAGRIPHTCWNAGMLARKIRTDCFPRVPAVHRLKNKIRRVVEDMRIDRREKNWLCAIGTILGVSDRNWRNILHLASFERVSRNFAPASSIDNVRIQRIRGGVSVFDHANRVPIAKGDFAVVAAARNTNRAAFLLPAENEVRKRIAGCDVIKLRSWLVIPSAPRFSAVDAHERALIPHQQNNVWIIWVNPHVLIVVATRGAAKTRPRFSAVRRFHRHSAGAIDDVWIFRINFWHRQIAATDASGWPSIRGDALPVFSRVIGTINPHIGAGSIFGARARYRGEKPAWLARRNREIDLDDALWKSVRQRMPSLASVCRCEKSSTCPVVLISVLPRTETQLPKRRINNIWVRRVDLHVRAADVLAFRKHLLPILPAIGGKINPALFIRSIGMPKRRGENSVRIARVDSKSWNALTIAKAKMRPRLSRVCGFVHTVTDGQIGPSQPFAARNINYIRIGRSDRNGSDSLRWLIVENWRPGAARIVCLPHAAVHGSNIKNIRLPGHTGRRSSPPAARGADHPPAQLLVRALGILLRLRHSRDWESTKPEQRNYPEQFHSSHEAPQKRILNGGQHYEPNRQKTQSDFIPNPSYGAACCATTSPDVLNRLKAQSHPCELSARKVNFRQHFAKKFVGR